MTRYRQIYGRTLCGLMLCLATACATLPERAAAVYSAALPPGEEGALERATARYEAEHPGRSGFKLLDQGYEAFALRALLAGEAQRSLDLQTYIWNDDLTGRYLAWEVLRAADRGVRVRLLLDDLDGRAKNDALVALDRHKNIEVRLYNPLASRRGQLAFFGEFLRSFHRLNHRMHVKNWIVDNRIAITGGRNVGDEYFSASDATNFVDVDFLMVGPVVRSSSEVFDRFWNSDLVYPIALLDPRGSAGADLDAVREALTDVTEQARGSRYADALQSNESIRQLVENGLSLQWESNYQLICDEPDKVDADHLLEKSAVLRELLPLLEKAQREVVIISPYFVPGDAGTQLLVELAKRGVDVQVMTNSLAANDVAVVHGGYARYRKQLLEGGVKLWETKPDYGAEVERSLLGSSGASLHAKSLTIDRSGIFIGSYNLDPRSTMLNAEMGVYVESPTLATQLVDDFLVYGSGEGVWRVTLQEGELRWSDARQTLDREPDASWWRRFQAWFAWLLPVDPLL